jgi:hypothetical protein
MKSFAQRVRNISDCAETKQNENSKELKRKKEKQLKNLLAKARSLLKKSALLKRIRNMIIERARDGKRELEFETATTFYMSNSSSDQRPFSELDDIPAQIEKLSGKACRPMLTEMLAQIIREDGDWEGINVKVGSRKTESRYLYYFLKFRW